MWTIKLHFKVPSVNCFLHCRQDSGIIYSFYLYTYNLLIVLDIRLQITYLNKKISL